MNSRPAGTAGATARLVTNRPAEHKPHSAIRAARLACTACFLAVLASGWLAADQESQHAGNRHAAALSQFQDRVKDYVALREKLKASLAAPKATNDAREVATRQQALLRAMRSARASAKAGDIFIPEVAPILSDIIRQDFQRRTPRERSAALQEVPAGLSLKVNDEYPKAIPLATVPPKLLAALPRLPDALEYRFVGRRLILHDTITNQIVDTLEDAVPSR